MRTWNHKINKTHSGKSVNLTAIVLEPYGKKTFCMSTLRGWRANLVFNYLQCESNTWDINIARKFVIMESVRTAKDQYEAQKFLSTVNLLGSMDIHFWSSKFLTNRNLASKAWRVFYT